MTCFLLPPLWPPHCHPFNRILEDIRICHFYFCRSISSLSPPVQSHSSHSLAHFALHPPQNCPCIIIFPPSKQTFRVYLIPRWLSLCLLLTEHRALAFKWKENKPASNLLCDFEEITLPFWASVAPFIQRRSSWRGGSVKRMVQIELPGETWTFWSWQSCDPGILLAAHGLFTSSLGWPREEGEGRGHEMDQEQDQERCHLQVWAGEGNNTHPYFPFHLLRPSSSDCGCTLVNDSLSLWVLTGPVCPCLKTWHI